MDLQNLFLSMVVNPLYTLILNSPKRKEKVFQFGGEGYIQIKDIFRCSVFLFYYSVFGETRYLLNVAPLSHNVKTGGEGGQERILEPMLIAYIIKTCKEFVFEYHCQAIFRMSHTHVKQLKGYSCMSDFEGRYCGVFFVCVSIGMLYSPCHFFFFGLYGPEIRNFVDMSILKYLGNNYKLIRSLSKVFYWTTNLFKFHICLLVIHSLTLLIFLFFFYS